MHSIFVRVKQHQLQNLPFAVYRKPKSKTMVGVFQHDDHLYFSENFTEKGFVFAPFEGTPIIFPLDKTEVKFNNVYFETVLEKQPVAIEENLYEKAFFTTLVKKGIQAIQKGFFSKVVLSRKETITIEEFDVERIFNRIMQAYPTAFCFCWFHPKIGMWMGATPEKLIEAKENQFTTMALAGTQLYKEDTEVTWKSKEKNEQEFVTHFILDNLKNHTSAISVSNPYTTRAGNLLHIRTDVEGTINRDSNLKKVLDILHPTPAVCGLPKNMAKDFILQNEGYDREFYTGFLGELNIDFALNEEASDIFVNLRSMKIEKDTNKYNINIFVGCGITADSDPELEWEETINKSKIMRQII